MFYYTWLLYLVYGEFVLTLTIFDTPLQAQASQQQPQQAAVTQGYQPPPTSSTAPAPGGLYPSLEDEYMGLQLTQYRPVSSYNNSLQDSLVLVYFFVRSGRVYGLCIIMAI